AGVPMGEGAGRPANRAERRRDPAERPDAVRRTILSITHILRSSELCLCYCWALSVASASISVASPSITIGGVSCCAFGCNAPAIAATKPARSKPAALSSPALADLHLPR